MSAAEKYEEFFKDKIDWKFFNYVLDKLLVYEDIDLNVTLLVRMPHDTSTDYIYQYGDRNNWNEYSSGYNDFYGYDRAKADITAYKIHPELVYSICVNDDPKYRGEIYDRIKDKCGNVKFEEVCLIVSPK